jgi:hypothetical protein
VARLLAVRKFLLNLLEMLMTASKLANALQIGGKIAFILPTTVWAVMGLLPTTPGWLVLKLLVFVFTLHWMWKLVAFGILAKGFTGDHKVKCAVCEKVVLPYASDMVVEMLTMMREHNCTGSHDAAK